MNNEAGTLYVVATPIGNCADMSPRGTQILSEVDIIAAEDTRRAAVMLNKLGLSNKTVSNHKFNEYGRTRQLLDMLRSGKSVAITSDAGTPCISDPGNTLVKAAVEEGINVVGVPGCCAAVNALSISAFDLSSFVFAGFFPRENGNRCKLFAGMRRNTQTRTYAFYESPKRILNVIEFLIDAEVGCRLCLCNDMTKLHEIAFRGTPAEVKEQITARWDEPKGEFVLVLELSEDYLITEKEHAVSPEAALVDVIIRNECTPKEAIKLLTSDERNTFSKNELYQASINLKKMF